MNLTSFLRSCMFKNGWPQSDNITVLFDSEKNVIIILDLEGGWRVVDRAGDNLDIAS